MSSYWVHEEPEGKRGAPSVCGGVRRAAGAGRGSVCRRFYSSHGKQPSGSGSRSTESTPTKIARFQDPGGLRREASGLGPNFHSDRTISYHSILGLFISRCCKTIENQRALVLEGVLLSLVQIITLPRLRGWLEARRNWPQAPGVWSWAPHHCNRRAPDPPRTLELRTV